ncbi:unnamed protein product [Acidithrix sp. C25]|nr:unnamed protein product [Acidithrix sp. C25]
MNVRCVFGGAIWASLSGVTYFFAITSDLSLVAGVRNEVSLRGEC